ncbi:MAG: hypothetical protein JOZ52_14865 [Acidobacteria bacterium]|nr:hypothetical protein [Acidobacteriota bacterium]
MNGHIPWSSPLIIVLGTAGFLAGFALMRYRYRADSQSRQFYGAEETLVWLSLMAAQTAVWAIVIAPLWKTLQAYAGYFFQNVAQVMLPIICLIALFLLPVLLLSKYIYRSPLKYHRGKLRIMSVTGGLIAAIAVINMLLIQAASYSVSGSTETQIKTYLSLRSELHTQLFFLGVIIGLATLATGALRNAILAAENREPATPDKAKKRRAYPAELVLLYGLYYTMLLAFAYVPVYLRMLEVGGDIRNSLYSISASSLADPSSLQNNREAIGKLLMLGTDPLTSLQAGVAILAPLASSIIAVLLGKGK